MADPPPSKKPRDDRERTPVKTEDLGDFDIAPELLELILSHLSLKDVESWAGTGQLAKSLALLSNVKKVSDIIRDMPVETRKYFTDSNQMLIRNVLYVMIKYTDEKHLFRIITATFPDRALLWAGLVRWTVDTDEIVFNVEESSRMRNSEFHTLDHKAKMVDRLIIATASNADAEIAYLEERDKEIQAVYDMWNVDLGDFGGNQDAFANEAEFNEDRDAKLAKLQAMIDQIDGAFTVLGGVDDAEAFRRESPFYMSPDGDVDPDMKQLRRLVGFLWQAVPTSREKKAVAAIQKVTGQFRRAIMAMIWPDENDHVQRMTRPDKTRFGNSLKNQRDREYGLVQSMFASAGYGHSIFMDIFMENKHPSPYMGWTPDQLKASLQTLTVDRDVPGSPTYGLRRPAAYVRERLQAGVFEMITWWTKNVGEYHFYYENEQWSHTDEPLMQRIASRTFRNLAEFLTHFLYQSGGEGNDEIATMTYTTRLVTWHRKLRALIVSVVPELAVNQMKVDAQYTAYDGFAFHEGLLKLHASMKRTHWRGALIKRK